MTEVVTISYEELLDEGLDLSDRLEQAYGVSAYVIYLAWGKRLH
jgi:hypothetical protein